MSSATISIIMPVKNASPFLEECLLSILNQSEINWELIAIDDHSTDISLSILRKFETKDDRIKILENKGHGIIDALSYGFKQSQGHFITRMDADDVMPSTKLATLKKNLIAKGKSHLSTGKVKYISESNLGDGFKKYEEWLNKLCETDSHYQEIYRECVIASPCWMMYREDFVKIGGFESSSYPEDYDLCFRMYANGITVVSSQETLHIWRDHSGRASRNDENYADNSFLNLKINYFLTLDYDDTKQLIVWGAGKKGKRIAQLLLSKNINFHWVTNNPNKIGKNIYNKILMSFDQIEQSKNTLNIIAVANAEDQLELVQTIEDHFDAYRNFHFC